MFSKIGNWNLHWITKDGPFKLWSKRGSLPKRLLRSSWSLAISNLLKSWLKASLIALLSSIIRSLTSFPLIISIKVSSHWTLKLNLKTLWKCSINYLIFQSMMQSINRLSNCASLEREEFKNRQCINSTTKSKTSTKR